MPKVTPIEKMPVVTSVSPAISAYLPIVEDLIKAKTAGQPGAVKIEPDADESVRAATLRLRRAGRILGVALHVVIAGNALYAEIGAEKAPATDEAAPAAPRRIRPAAAAPAASEAPAEQAS
jgi:hypothetical protein